MMIRAARREKHVRLPFSVVELEKIKILIPFVSNHLNQSQSESSILLSTEIVSIQLKTFVSNSESKDLFLVKFRITTNPIKTE